VLVPLSFHGFNEHVLRRHAELGGLYQTLAIAVLAVVTLTATWGARRRVLADLFRRQWLPLAIILLMAFLALWDLFPHLPEDAGRWALVPTILTNLAMLACGLWLIAVGLREERGRPFTAGVLYFLLWAVLRYVDVFGAFGGMLGAALMFFLCGAALFGVAQYWRRRKGVRRA
jgi:hypothetical protein